METESQIFLLALMLMLTRRQEPLNQFPDFSQRTLFCVLLLNQCDCGVGVKKGPELSILLSSCHHYSEFTCYIHSVKYKLPSGLVYP